VSHDGAQIALAASGTDDNLVVVDRSNMAVTATAHVPDLVRGLSFTNDDSGLMVYASNEDLNSGLSQGAPQALLLDASDLSVKWQAGLRGVHDGFSPGDSFQGDPYSPGTGTRYLPGVAFSPANDLLYIAHADEDRLTRVDFASRKVSVRTIRPALSLLERWMSLGVVVAQAKEQSGTEKHAAMSQDGKWLYITGMDNQLSQNIDGYWNLKQTTLDFQVVEAVTGAEVLTMETGTDQVAVMPDGLVLLRSWNGRVPWSRVYDPETRQTVQNYDGMFQSCVPLTNGSYVLGPSIEYGNSMHDMRVFEPASGKVLGAWKVDNFNTQWVACNP